eukprot:TRINITY_DN3888_c0_g3_i1.p1 TRINITY_DN3888_c0_g3~~TRINITY_DN3888_c0_g3_i1.p1  ORF type:complete len:1067 (+),score=202.64 TRINITY_DN3888_c0_g3_i1:66-3266(+)
MGRLCRRLSVLLCFLILLGRVCALEWSEVEADPLPDGLWVVENIIILSVAGAVCIFVIIGLVVQFALAGSVRLPLLVLAVQLVAIMAVGVCTWVVTYEAARDAIERHANGLLVFAGHTASHRTTADLQSGVAALRILSNAVQGGRLDVEGGYPDVHEWVLRVLQPFAETTDSLAMIYIGTESGRVNAVIPRRFSNGTLDASGVVLLVGSPPRHCGDGFDSAGRPLLPCKPAFELRCSTADQATCLHHACAEPHDQNRCRFCRTALGNVVNDSEVCPNCVACNPWLPGTFGEFAVPADIRQWDLPEQAQVLGGYCVESIGDEWESHYDVVQGYRRDGTPGRGWVGGRQLSGAGVNCSFKFDPRLRPWYTRAEGLVWSPVYQFVGVQQAIEMGITATVAVRNPAGLSPPFGSPARVEDSSWVCVVAVDYTFRSVSLFLRRVVPTNHSAVLISDLEGTLVAGSLEPELLSERTVDSQGVVTFKSVNVLRAHWKMDGLNEAYPRIVSRFGSLSAATHTKAILHGGESAVLSQPILTGDLRWLMAISMPYSDITEDSERANTQALIIAVSVCMVTGAMTWGLMSMFFAPLTRLRLQMNDVALMRLQNLKPIDPGVTMEVRKMVSHFGVMVDSLRELREFMPQALFCAVEGTGVPQEEDGDTQSEWTQAPAGSSLGGSSRRLERSQVGSVVSPLRCPSDTAAFGSKREWGRPRAHSGDDERRDTHSTVHTDGPRHADRAGDVIHSPPPIIVSQHDLGLSLFKRTVVMLVSNVRGWQHLCFGLEDVAGTLSSLHEKYMLRCVEAVKKTRGVIDNSNGDKVQFTFNAARARHLACSADAALRCGYMLCRMEGELNKSPPHVSCGAARGHAFCGNFGCAGSKRVGVAGGVAAFVHVCERLAARWGLPYVCDHSTQRESVQFEFRVIHSVVYPKQGTMAPTSVWQVLTELEEGNQEWMYQYKAHTLMKKFSRYNDVVEAYFRGETDLVRRLLEQGSEDADVMAIADSLVSSRPERLYFDDSGGAGDGPVFAHAVRSDSRQRPSANQGLCNTSPKPMADEASAAGTQAAACQLVDTD